MCRGQRWDLGGPIPSGSGYEGAQVGPGRDRCGSPGLERRVLRAIQDARLPESIQSRALASGALGSSPRETLWLRSPPCVCAFPGAYTRPSGIRSWLPGPLEQGTHRRPSPACWSYQAPATMSSSQCSRHGDGTLIADSAQSSARVVGESATGPFAPEPSVGEVSGTSGPLREGAASVSLASCDAKQAAVGFTNSSRAPESSSEPQVGSTVNPAGAMAANEADQAESTAGFDRQDRVVDWREGVGSAVLEGSGCP